MERRIGIDIGGTTISIIDMYEPSQTLHHITIPTPKTAAEITSSIINSIQPMIESGDTPIGIGIGIAGSVDSHAGSILYSPNLPFKEEYKLAAAIQKGTGLPVKVDNDANAAAVGEHLFGGAKGMDDFIVITLGTGIGGGIYSGGKLLRGADGAGGEVGHMPVGSISTDGMAPPLCQCGAFGCLEAYSSGTGLKNLSTELFGKTLSAKEICKAAAKGDEDAIFLLDNGGEKLGIALITLVNIFNPEAIFFTGSLAAAGEIYFNPAIVAVRENCFGSMGDNVRLEVSGLRQDIGVLGAAAIAG